MICLDTDAAIAAFQTNPQSAELLAHRDRVRWFMELHAELGLMFPSVALSEYLWGADRDDLDATVTRVARTRMFVPPFNELTSEICAQLGRQYNAAVRSGDVVRVDNYGRVSLKCDLLIISTALQNNAQYFLTGDAGCHSVATFAGLNAILLRELPDRPPPMPPPPPLPLPGRKKKPAELFDDLPEGDGSGIDQASPPSGQP